MMRLAVAVTASLMLMPFALEASLDSYEGRPTIDQHNSNGYYVWRDGNRWHIRWIAMDRAHEFEGSVASEGGTVTAMKQVDPAVEGKFLDNAGYLTVSVGPANGVRMPPPPEVRNDDRTTIRNDGDAKIVFDARINHNIGGFDFTPGDSTTTLRFELKVDGKPKTDMIRIGRSGQKPTDLPLVVSLK